MILSSRLECRKKSRIARTKTQTMQPINLKPTGSLSSVAIPHHAVQQRFRPPKKNVPQTAPERNRILQFIRHYVAE